MTRLTIQEVSERLSLPKSTLRYWEKQFAGLIVPERTRGGQRRYHVKDLAVFEAISDMKKYGLSLARIRKRLIRSSRTYQEIDPVLIDELTERLTGVLRQEIYDFLKRRI